MRTLKYASLVVAGLVAAGSAFGQGDVVIKVQSFCATGCASTQGPYVPSPGMTHALIECIGGGGGGGDAVSNPTGMNAGGEGGNGGFSKKDATAAMIGASQPIVIGLGGLPGSAGGDTSVGSLCVAKGGSGGQPGTPGMGGAGGAGGIVGTGDVAIAGNAGAAGRGAPVIAAPDPLHAADPPLAVNGVPPKGPKRHGIGGTGGIVAASSASAVGGAGASGVVTITEYGTKP
jgi:hypothetical protein